MRLARSALAPGELIRIFHHMKTLRAETIGNVHIKLLDLGDGRYQVEEPGIFRPPTSRLETAEYDFDKAVAARRGEGRPPLAYYLRR